MDAALTAVNRTNVALAGDALAICLAMVDRIRCAAVLGA